MKSLDCGQSRFSSDRAAKNGGITKVLVLVVAIFGAVVEHPPHSLVQGLKYDLLGSHLFNLCHGHPAGEIVGRISNYFA